LQQNLELKDLLPYGFAIHHAGMTRYLHNFICFYSDISYSCTVFRCIWLLWWCSCFFFCRTEVWNVCSLVCHLVSLTSY